MAPGKIGNFSGCEDAKVVLFRRGQRKRHVPHGPELAYVAQLLGFESEYIPHTSAHNLDRCQDDECQVVGPEKVDRERRRDGEGPHETHHQVGDEGEVVGSAVIHPPRTEKLLFVVELPRQPAETPIEPHVPYVGVDGTHHDCNQP